ncbi:MAG: hypothetical protein IMZ62_02440, partial [Chloroflexi bacterium]|nr:hypothetical protein [Chloroflexota bacterium]
TSTSPVGSYPSSCSGAVDANYTIGYTAGSVSVTVNNPVPSITTLDPTSATASGAAFTLTVNGANFVNGAIVRWNGTDRTTTYDSSTQLRAIILATDITAAEVPLVTVFNPTPGGGTSDEKPFFITTTGALVASSTTETGIDLTITNGSVTAATTGTGTVTVAQYASDPGGTPTFTATGQYFDVQISGIFTSVTIDICGLASGTTIYFWTGTAWVVASNQSYSAGCVTVTVNATTVPNLTQLAGAIFGVGNNAPTISIGAPSATITTGGPVTYTVTYADTNFNSSALVPGNITLNKTGTANGTIDVSGSGLTRTVTISSITGIGTLGISIAAGTASDLAGNTAPAPGPSATFIVATTRGSGGQGIIPITGSLDEFGLLRILILALVLVADFFLVVRTRKSRAQR